MKKIIPFKKDIIFKTNLSEITSISLEHELTNEGEDIHGTFIISGRYKIADTSTNVEEFNYDLPFNIKIDDKYDVSNMIVDIDDFYYEIINNNVLSVNIDVLIDKLEEKKIEELKEHIMNIENLNVDEMEDRLEELDREEEILDVFEEATQKEIVESKMIKERCIEDEEKPKKDTRVLSSIFDNLDESNETYKSYHIYIVREGDSLENIIIKYGVTKEELENYNDLSELKVNDKIIIPADYAES